MTQSSVLIETTQIARSALQQAIALLLRWAGSDLPPGCPPPGESPAIQWAKAFLPWTDPAGIDVLQLLFDRVCLDPNQTHAPMHYLPLKAIANSEPQIPYPLKTKPSPAEQDAFKQEVKTEVLKALEDPENWHNLSLLMLIVEKYGSCLSFGEPDVALVDKVRITAAIAAALVENPEAEKLSLIAGDLSGIQNFIYTIAADGALKSLRARSFYLELVTEEIVQQLLTALNLPRTSIIYAGGGNLYLLASGTPETLQKVQQLQAQFNGWLMNEFQKKIFLALSCVSFSTPEVATKKFIEHWQGAIRELNKQKMRKFADQISSILKPAPSYVQTCRVCHRDDLEEQNLKPLNDPDAPLACPTCRTMFELGEILLKVDCVVRSSRPPQDREENVLKIELPATKTNPDNHHYYRMSEYWKQVENTSDAVFLINDWEIEHYKFRHFPDVSPLLLGNYGQSSKAETGFMTASEFAKVGAGSDRVGYLRMDVDRLGQIFAQGLHHCFSLPRLAGLSRQMSYFFKVYLNSLAKQRSANLPKNAQVLTHLADEKPSDRPHLLFIYAGGDDLFVSGAWNEVVEFGFDVYQSFRAYTGQHPDITLSAGVSLAGAKFPLYQAAEEAGAVEKAAKENGRDSLGLFNVVLKWDEWLGKWNEKVLKPNDLAYLQSVDKPILFGVFPFVERLSGKVGQGYTRSFVRNLLNTAQIQEQAIKEKQEKLKEAKRNLKETKENSQRANDGLREAEEKLRQMEEEYPIQVKDLRYYLHLPKIAYTLARLPDKIRDAPDFQPIRTSLKSPYNAPYFRAIATWIELLNRSSKS
jgi:CRISPR-associated protein Csm1